MLYAPAPALAAGQKLLAIINDKPITDYDVAQRIKINKLMGQSAGGNKRKEAFQDLIDDEVLKAEFTRRKIQITDKQIDEWLKDMAQSSGGLPQLKARLKKNGVNFSALRDQVAGSIRMRHLLRSKNVSVEVDDKSVNSKVEREYAKIMNDPRLKPVTVMRVLEINLPVDSTSKAMQQQLVYARAIEAQQIMQRYKGCSSAKAASKGIYNVKVGKILEADSRKLPAQLRKALLNAGTRKLIGPAKSPKGLQLIGLCGSRKISPKMPPKEQIKKNLRAKYKNELMNRKFRQTTDKLMRDLRRGIFIDYKDRSLVK